MALMQVEVTSIACAQWLGAVMETHRAMARERALKPITASGDSSQHAKQEVHRLG